MFCESYFFLTKISLTQNMTIIF